MYPKTYFYRRGVKVEARICTWARVVAEPHPIPDGWGGHTIDSRRTLITLGGVSKTLADAAKRIEENPGLGELLREPDGTMHAVLVRDDSGRSRLRLPTGAVVAALPPKDLRIALERRPGWRVVRRIDELGAVVIHPTDDNMHPDPCALGSALVEKHFARYAHPVLLEDFER